MKGNIEILDLLRGYRVEADGFGAIAEMDGFQNLLARFADYRGYLVARNAAIESDRLVDSLSDGTGVIDATAGNPQFRELLLCAHVAVCCEMFRGWEISVHHRSREEILNQIVQNLEISCAADSAMINRLYNRLNNGDTVRCIQILRLLGLAAKQPGCYTQLSLGSGIGTRDIRAVHATPFISIKNSSKGHGVNSALVRFETVPHRPGFLILADGDPELRDHYANLTSNNQEWLVGINQEAEQAMAGIPSLIASRRVQPPNLVVGMRIDHRMIPDTPRFLGKLAEVIGDTAELFFTIGAGDTVNEFKGRVNVIKALFDHLSASGMSPVRIILHGGGSYELQRNSLCFGLAQTASYEILHCRLNRRKLRSAFSVV